MAMASMPSARWPSIHAQRFLGVQRVEAAEGLQRHLAAPEDHVAVEVLARGPGGRVLVADEGREVAGVVVALGGLDDLLPGGAGHVPVVEVVLAVGVRQAFPKVSDHGLKAGAGSCGIRCPAYGVGQHMIAVLGILVREFPHHAEIEGMIRDGEEVERCMQLHHAARRVLDGLPPGERVGLVGRAPRSHEVGIEGEDRVYVGIAEIGVPERIRCDFGRLRGCCRVVRCRRRVGRRGRFLPTGSHQRQ